MVDVSRVRLATNVRVLDGGMPKWKAESRPLETGAAKPRAAKTFTPRFNRNMVASIDDVQKVLLDKTAQVVDARSAGRFRGEAPEPRPGMRGGHMPGSFNVPYDKVLKDGRLKSHEAIAAAFDQAGVDLDKPVDHKLRLRRHRLDPDLRDRCHRQGTGPRLRRLMGRMGRAAGYCRWYRKERRKAPRSSALPPIMLDNSAAAWARLWKRR